VSDQFLTGETIQDDSSYSSNSSRSENGLNKIAIGALVGAVLGGFAVALANRETTDQVNQTIRNVGRTAKTTADNLNDTIQQIGSAVSSVSENINGSTRDVNDAVSSVTANVSNTVRNTVTAVKGTAEGVNQTVKSAMDVMNIVKATANSVQTLSQPAVNVSADVTSSPTGETLYRLVPVSQNSK
jgi:gas vesicle protein